jgi:hypothetical protein
MAYSRREYQAAQKIPAARLREEQRKGEQCLGCVVGVTRELARAGQVK